MDSILPRCPPNILFKDNLERERYAAHVLLGSRIASSGLEGASFPGMLKHLTSFTSSEAAQEENPLLIGLNIELNQCQKWSEGLARKNVKLVAKSICEKVQNLSLGQSLLLPGGWMEETFGHSMLYRLTKQSDSKYSLTIINTGRGTNYHHQLEDIKEVKVLLACNFAEIPSDDLFFGLGGSDFFEDLLSLQITPQKADFSPKVIYEGILGRLSPYRNDRELR